MFRPDLDKLWPVGQMWSFGYLNSVCQRLLKYCPNFSIYLVSIFHYFHYIHSCIFKPPLPLHQPSSRPLSQYRQIWQRKKEKSPCPRVATHSSLWESISFIPVKDKVWYYWGSFHLRTQTNTDTTSSVQSNTEPFSGSSHTFVTKN